MNADEPPFAGDHAAVGSKRGGVGLSNTSR